MKSCCMLIISTIICAVIDEMSTAESLQFDFKTINDATNNFSEENRLGEGGFGAVYKVQL